MISRKLKLNTRLEIKEVVKSSKSNPENVNWYSSCKGCRHYVKPDRYEDRNHPRCLKLFKFSTKMLACYKKDGSRIEVKYEKFYSPIFQRLA